MDNVEVVLQAIHEAQAQPGGTGNPEGYTEVHTYHVWEVLHALRNLGDIDIEHFKD